MQVINLIFVVAFAQVGMSQESVFRWRLCPFLRNLHIEKARDKANNGIPVNQSLYQACLRGTRSMPLYYLMNVNDMRLKQAQSPMAK